MFPHRPMPWEQGFAGLVLGGMRNWLLPPIEFAPRGEEPPDLPPVRREVKTRKSSALTATDADDEAKMSCLATDSVIVAKLDRMKLSIPNWASFKDAKAKAYRLWDTILNLAGSASRLYLQMQGETSEQDRMTVLKDALRKKAASTLEQRAYAVMAYVRWDSPSGAAGRTFPISEEAAYRYLRWLRDVRAAPTRAASFISAITLTNAILEIEEVASFKSARVVGCADEGHSAERPSYVLDALHPRGPCGEPSAPED